MQRGLQTLLETALGLSDGLVFSDLADKDQRIVFSARFACPESGFTIDEIEPRLFSFNNPYGACPSCDGSVSAVILMNSLSCQTGKLVSKRSAGAMVFNSSRYYLQTLESLAKQFKFSWTFHSVSWMQMCNRSFFTGRGKCLLQWNLMTA